MYFVSLLLKFNFVLVAQATNQGRIIKQWNRFSSNFGYGYPRRNTNIRNRASKQRIDMEDMVNRKEFNNYKHGNAEYELIVEGNHGDMVYKVSYDDDKTGYNDFNDNNENDYLKFLLDAPDNGNQYVININILPEVQTKPYHFTKRVKQAIVRPFQIERKRNYKPTIRKQPSWHNSLTHGSKRLIEKYYSC